MAIVPKSAVLQVRLDPRFLDRFKAVCEHADIKPAQAARIILETYVVQAEEKLRKASKTASEAISKAAGAEVSEEVKELPVERSKQSQVPSKVSLADRMRAEREAKKAKAKKREDRWLKD